MKIQQLQYYDKSWIVHTHSDGFDSMHCQFVLAFGDPSLITDTSVFNRLERSFAEAHIILSSAPPTLLLPEAETESVMVTAVEFDSTNVHCAETHIESHANAQAAGQYLMRSLQQKDLLALFIITDNTAIKNSELLKGINAANPAHIPMGIMGGNDNRVTGLNKLPVPGMIVAVGFYGAQPKNMQVNKDHEYIYTLISNRTPYAIS